jgi:hypothetical protein
MRYELRMARRGSPTIVTETYDDRAWALRALLTMSVTLHDLGKLVYLRFDTDDLEWFEDEIAILTTLDGEVWTVVEVEL